MARLHQLHINQGLKEFDFEEACVFTCAGPHDR